MKKYLYCHRDGSVTYWSVYQQSWVRRAWRMPDEELAACSEHERTRAIRHMRRHRHEEGNYEKI